MAENAEMDNETLENLAVQELLQEAKRGKERAKDLGSLGWQKSNVPPANKRFLKNMLVSTLRHAHRQDRKYSSKHRVHLSRHDDRNNHRKRQHHESDCQDYGDFDAYKYANSEYNGRHSIHHRSSIPSSRWDHSSFSESEKEATEAHRSSKQRKKNRVSKEHSSRKSKKSHKSKDKSPKSSKSQHKRKNKHRHKQKEKI